MCLEYEYENEIENECHEPIGQSQKTLKTKTMPDFQNSLLITMPRHKNPPPGGHTPPEGRSNPVKQLP